jgi:hypothetical protein
MNVSMPSSSANAATSSAQVDAKLTDSLPNLTSAGPVQAVDTFGIVLTGGRVEIRSGVRAFD